MGGTTPPAAQHLDRTVVLIGMMGAGKTAVGRAVAARLGAAMHDSDAEMETSARLRIEEIFTRYGEAFFREKETQVIARLLQGPPCILSTGGGAWMSEANRRLMMDKATVLWLEADLDLLWSRVRHKTHRPLLRTANPRQTLADLLTARGPIYALAPHKITVQPSWSIDETASHVLASLKRTGAVTDGETTR